MTLDEILAASGALFYGLSIPPRRVARHWLATGHQDVAAPTARLRARRRPPSTTLD